MAVVSHAPSVGTVIDNKGQLAQIARTYGIHRCWLVGSVARGEARPESDIDFLLEVAPGTTLLEIIGFEQDAGEALGHPVHAFSTGVLRGPLAEMGREGVEVCDLTDS